MVLRGWWQHGSISAEYSERMENNMTTEIRLGSKIKDMRNQMGLTQQELADRTELTKGFISQLERDLTVPSVTTLIDIARCLGCSPGVFFEEKKQGKLVYRESDYCEKEEEDLGSKVKWLISDAQKNRMEPIMVILKKAGETKWDKPHEGEEFGYVIKGKIALYVGDERYIVNSGESFYYSSDLRHRVVNVAESESKYLWVATPPSF